MEKGKIRYFTISNRIGELTVLASITEDLAQQWHLPDALAMNINLVMEEALSNIIYYAYNDSAEHKIRISISLGKQGLTIRIRDDGIPFDPSSHLLPDISLSAMDRPVGGLGIFLISKFMDTVHYSRKNYLNILTLTKKI